jgi:hypothetical protein
MCNYYARYRELRNLQSVFRFPEQPNDPPRYVVRPTDTERVVAVGKDGGRHAVPMRWGLVPWWAKDIETGLTLFNWQSETVLEKARLPSRSIAVAVVSCRATASSNSRGRRARSSRGSSNCVTIASWRCRLVGAMARADGCAACGTALILERRDVCAERDGVADP